MNNFMQATFGLKSFLFKLIVTVFLSNVMTRVNLIAFSLPSFIYNKTRQNLLAQVRKDTSENIANNFPTTYSFLYLMKKYHQAVCLVKNSVPNMISYHRGVNSFQSISWIYLPWNIHFRFRFSYGLKNLPKYVFNPSVLMKKKRKSTHWDTISKQPEVSFIKLLNCKTT